MLNSKSNKKANIVQIVFIWIFSSFSYFTWGYPIVSDIVTEVFLPNNPTNIMYFFGIIIPFIPILGLVIWGYWIGQDMGIIGNTGVSE